MNQLEEQVVNYLDRHKEELFTLLSKLLQIESINYNTSGDEANCIPLLQAEYEKLGLTPEIYYPDSVPGVRTSPDYLPGRSADKRPNIRAVYPGGSTGKSVMLAAHTDTMPIGNRALWTSDPLGGEIRDGRIYGRGANDNKFGLASSIMALRAILDSGVRLEHSVILEAYCDEEYGGGNGALAASLHGHCDAIINTDGGNFEIWSCSMGGQGLAISVKALESQDSADLIVDALQIVRDELKPFIQNRYAELAADRYFAGTDMQRSAFRLHELRAGDNACDLDIGRLQFVYYTNRNKAQIDSELAGVEDRICSRLKPLKVESSGFQPTTRFFHCLNVPDEDPMLQTLKCAAEDITGQNVPISGACLSDLSLFLKHGSPHSVNFGIIRDFRLYGGAHQPDEFVEQEAFLNHSKALALFLLRWCGAK